MELISIDDVRAAAERVQGKVLRTPVLHCDTARGGLWVKPENLQQVGAFKLRGATNALACLEPGIRAAGVVTHSSGNHGQALAYAARAAGVSCTVVTPENAPPVKVAAMRRFGAEVVLVPPAEREPTVARLAAERGLTPIPPFDHPDVIAGQGTIGLEVLADVPDVATVLVPVGGGGLASGVATAVRALRPDVAVIGVEPELAADAAESLAAGRLVPWPPERTHRTIADGVRVGLSERTFAHVRARIEKIVTVTEDEIRTAMAALARDARIVAEPSGALASAAFLAGRVTAEEAPAGRTVAVVSGGNVEPALLAETLVPPTGHA
ncbi:threonine dehydratase [Murinocardiopsis flavida]|uniref:Threonine dehydratase n=1 Tax=Murinocardiopsis flavida TaxID=645275 RepID=A0A2P8DP95_9ACTN|nr:threonine/serine dehydratase [Murinocardiopsis flavida]PSK99045.1 threonine dehydratase [Murinocardiopsis flavida]